MKILVVQLARLGDIYLTWPTLRALRRKHPQAEIHLLVRKKFSGAAEGLDSVDKIWEMDTSDILSSVLFQDDEERAQSKLTHWIDDLRGEVYDDIINLTFSPLSSYMTHSLAEKNTIVRGYSRFEDGPLSIHGEVSAYFYAQVGIERYNRIHVADLFAGVAEVELESGDWRPALQLSSSLSCQQILMRFGLNSDQYLLLHIGASQIQKSYGPFKWRQTLKSLAGTIDIPVILVGSAEDREAAKSISEDIDSTVVVDLTGQTTLVELSVLVAHSRAVVGCDSMVMHLAALCNQACLNLSFSSVNFWETGPVSEEGRIVYADSPEDLASDRVAMEMRALIKSEKTNFPSIVPRLDPPVRFAPLGYTPSGEFEWEMIMAIYMGQKFPIIDDVVVYKGILRLHELAQMALEQLSLLNGENNQDLAMQILGQVDILLISVEKMVPSLRPIIWWFQTERVRIGPGSVDEIKKQTQQVFKNLAAVVANYVAPSKEEKGESYANPDVF